MELKDFKRVPKSHPRYNQRWYINTKTGQEITRRAYQTIRNSGIKPEVVAADRRDLGASNPKQKRTNALVRAYKEKTAAKLGVKPRQVKVRGNSDEAKEFRATLKELANLTGKDARDNSKDGKKAKLLVKLNMRKPEWDMPVGES